MIKFRQLTQSAYNSLSTYDESTMYIISDAGAGRIYLGSQRKGECVTASYDSTTKKITINGTELDISAFQTASEVEAAINAKIAGVYKIKGSATVATINNLTTMEAGDVYNMTDAGTINQPSGATLEPFAVAAGDNIVYTAAGWDKFASTVDLSNYYTKSQSDSTFATKTELTDVEFVLTKKILADETRIGTLETTVSTQASTITSLTTRIAALESALDLAGA